MTEKAPSTIEDLLFARYPVKTHALMFEVRNAAGFSATRSCDAMAMSLWPSRGLDLTGMEIKVSRSDWLRELKAPEKAESFFTYCDRWYLVTGAPDVAKIEEIPETWGWIERTGSRLTTRKEAPRLTPKPLSRGMLATLLKRCNDTAKRPTDEAFQAGIKHGRESERNDAEYRQKRAIEEHVRLQTAVREFEQASGITLSYRYESGKKVGEVVSLVMRDGHLAHQHRLASLRRDADQLVEHLKVMEATLVEPVR